MTGRFLLTVVFAFVFTGCASGTFKERQAQREKASASSGMFCEFISSDLYPDLDVELNLRMAKRCDSDKNFSITGHKNSSDQTGVIYCCGSAASPVKRAEAKPAAAVKPATPAANTSDEIIE